MTLVVKLYVVFVLSERFPYLYVCQAHKINRSFTQEDSCELVTEKTSELWKTVPFLWSRLVVRKV